MEKQEGKEKNERGGEEQEGQKKQLSKCFADLL